MLIRKEAEHAVDRMVIGGFFSGREGMDRTVNRMRMNDTIPP